MYTNVGSLLPGDALIDRRGQIWIVVSVISPTPNGGLHLSLVEHNGTLHQLNCSFTGAVEDVIRVSTIS